VQERHRGEWREPLTGLSWPHLILRNGRRLLKPDVRGGRLAPVANRGELGAWLWGLGLDMQRRQPARRREVVGIREHEEATERRLNADVARVRHPGAG
jgi:hypothetical protein